MATDSNAPGQLELVREFVNTRDVEEGLDELDTPAKLQAWLAQRGLAAGGRPRAADVSRAIAIREALRELLLANNGEPFDPAAIDTLNDGLARAKLGVRFQPGDDRPVRAALEPAGGGLDQALAALLAIVFRSMEDGTWARLKACREDTCQWGFYDQSKNRSGTWCSMEVCGNRAKARKYRERHG